jgi:hypothetical protein
MMALQVSSTASLRWVNLVNFFFFSLMIVYSLFNSVSSPIALTLSKSSPMAYSSSWQVRIIEDRTIKGMV